MTNKSHGRSRLYYALLLLFLWIVIWVVMVPFFLPSWSLTPTQTIVSFTIVAAILGIAYFLYARGSFSQRRVAYIVTWGLALGFPFYVLFILIYEALIKSVPYLMVDLFFYAVGVVIGGFIGDRAGRRLKYRVWGRMDS